MQLYPVALVDGAREKGIALFGRQALFADHDRVVLVVDIGTDGVLRHQIIPTLELDISLVGIGILGIGMTRKAQKNNLGQEWTRYYIGMSI
jgi:hypothetical protein